MADANTTAYGLVKPEVGASADTWGGKVNADMDDIDALLKAIATTGSADAYVLTTSLSLAAYVTGQSFLILPNFTNTGAATINVDGLGTKTLTKNGTTALESGDLVSGTIYRVTYDGTQFQVDKPLSGAFQALDATLTALAALSWSSGEQALVMTAADTFSLYASASQADMESASSTTTFVTPGRVQSHPGVAKAWAQFTPAASLTVSYGVSSLGDNGTGNFDVNFSTNFSSANFAAVATLDVDLATNARFANVVAKFTTAVRVCCGYVSSTAAAFTLDEGGVDSISVVCFGDQ